jgi:NAD(P) transhydrogenase subunit beta
LGLKGLSHPRTAVAGNRKGAAAMLVAIVATLVDQQVVSYELIFSGLALGTIIGGILAVRVQTTEMPQLVGAFNGFGGIASILVAGGALMAAVGRGAEISAQVSVATVASALIGSVTFWGSLVAVCKLQGIIVPSGAVTSPLLKGMNLLFALSAIALCVLSATTPENLQFFWILVGVASVLGITLVVPIGGADMPVVIALLNSYSGLAACATGFVLSNSVLIIAGSLVGASGLILTQIMCKAMNRSLTNVLFGGIGASGDDGEALSQDEIYAGKITSSSADEASMIFESASRVVIIPGYGMAVAQAQHAVRDFANYLEENGTEVLYAIHPVAGRMPGHMNVLLAEADIPYDKLIEMDEINPSFPETDITLIIGANDVVNPLAREANSPISGMPILDADKSNTVIVIKRSLSPGYAGIPNPLFAAPNCMMLFGDGKKMVLELISAMKENA